MAGSYADIQIDTSPLDRALAGLSDAFEDMTPIMELTGAVVVASVQRNFEDEGRPGWAPLSPVTVALRGTAAHILQVQGPASGLLGSIHYVAKPDSVQVGTNKIYAAVHQFGAKQGAFGRTRRGGPIPWGDIPARPFIMVQPEDWEEIALEIEEYLTKYIGGNA
ncbi:MAG: phage virion morphogenesis protein [Patescibacteria group bacterium]